jgi:hypothetical protein
MSAETIVIPSESPKPSVQAKSKKFHVYIQHIHGRPVSPDETYSATLFESEQEVRRFILAERAKRTRDMIFCIYEDNSCDVTNTVMFSDLMEGRDIANFIDFWAMVSHHRRCGARKCRGKPLDANGNTDPPFDSTNEDLLSPDAATSIDMLADEIAAQKQGRNSDRALFRRDRPEEAATNSESYRCSNNLCGKLAAPGKTHQRCSRCNEKGRGEVLYCNADCQRTHWVMGHSKVCSK